MADDNKTAIQGKARDLSPVALGWRLFSLDLKRKYRGRKTLFLLAVQLLPAFIVGLALIWQDMEGIALFEGAVESVYIPLLLPLTALFFGGPTVVDEVEGQTITYLTLRPLSRTTLYLAKLATSVCLAVAVSVVPILILFGICTIGGIIGADGAFALLGSSIATVAFGAVAYTAIFALLGVVFSATLLPGIVYYVVFELILGAIPVIEMISLKFHLRLMGGFDTGEGGAIRETLEQMLLDQALTFEWWFGLIFTTLATAGAVVLGALLFKNRQFHV